MDLSRLRDLLQGEPAGEPDEARRRADRLEARSSAAIVTLATAWFGAVALWGLFGKILAGHYASTASMGIIAENMHRYRMIHPVWLYTSSPPDSSMVYCHHPWGIFWMTAAFFEVLGRHDYVCRLPAALLSIATPPLVAALCRALYRPIAGACAAVAFVVLPITLSFAQFNALEVPVIAWSALFLWAWIRARQTERRGFYIVMVIGATMAMNSDWPAFVLVAAVLAIEAGAVVASWKRPGRPRTLGWVALAAAAVFVGSFYLLTFRRLGKLDDLFDSYELRSFGKEQPLSQKLAQRRFWIELSFTPIAIALGKAAAVVAALRTVVLARAVELAPLAVLSMALLQYLAFPQGADIHVFWPHHFALYFAVATGAVTATIARPIARILGEPRSSFVALGIVVVPLLFVLRDGVEALGWARRTGGRFNEKGAYIQSDGDKIAVLSRLGEELPPTATVGLHSSAGFDWAGVWALGGRVVEPVGFLPPDGALAEDAVVADLRNMDEAEATSLLFGCEVRAYGPYLVAKRGTGFEAWSLDASEPTTGQWLLDSGSEPRWSSSPDAFATWEIAVHYGLDAAPPEGAPATLEEKRVAHNVALARGDEPARAALFEDLARELEPKGWVFTDGTELVGFRLDRGVSPRVTVMFRAAGELPPGVAPKIRSRVVERATLSTTMPDPTRREVAPRPLISPRLWRKGWVYSLTAPLLERPGVESFELTFTGYSAPRPPRGGASVELFRY